jgi:hypothetical protein
MNHREQPAQRLKKVVPNICSSSCHRSSFAALYGTTDSALQSNLRARTGLRG